VIQDPDVTDRRRRDASARRRNRTRRITPRPHWLLLSVLANAATSAHTAQVKSRTIALTFDDGRTRASAVSGVAG
jgi:hypothetical protein